MSAAVSPPPTPSLWHFENQYNLQTQPTPAANPQFTILIFLGETLPVCPAPSPAGDLSLNPIGHCPALTPRGMAPATCIGRETTPSLKLWSLMVILQLELPECLSAPNASHEDLRPEAGHPSPHPVSPFFHLKKNYMLQCYCLKSPHPLLFPLSPNFCSLCLCLLCCPECRIIGTIFPDSIHMF